MNDYGKGKGIEYGGNAKKNILPFTDVKIQLYLKVEIHLVIGEESLQP